MRKTLALTILLAVLWPASPAHASCYSEPRSLAEQLAHAPAAFVGTVQSTTNRGRVAHVAVEEVWKGGALPSSVEVRGTPLTDENAMTSNDRSFTAGVRYLFVPQGMTDGGTAFSDNVCTATQEYGPHLDELRPHSGTEEGAPPSGEPAAEPGATSSKAAAEPGATSRKAAAEPAAEAVHPAPGTGGATPSSHGEPDTVVLASSGSASAGVARLPVLPVVLAATALLAAIGLLTRQLLSRSPRRSWPV